MAQLAGMIRTKYPGLYDDMDDATLERAIVAKYPGQYDDLIEPTPPVQQPIQPIQQPIQPEVQPTQPLQEEEPSWLSRTFGGGDKVSPNSLSSLVSGEEPQERDRGFRDYAAMGVRGLSALVPGGIPGAVAGGVGEFIAQTIEPRDDYNYLQMGTQAGLGAIPFGRVGSISRSMLKGGVMGAGGATATQLAETGELPELSDLALPTAIGAVGGGVVPSISKFRNKGKLSEIAKESTTRGIDPDKNPRKAELIAKEETGLTTGEELDELIRLRRADNPDIKIPELVSEGAPPLPRTYDESMDPTQLAFIKDTDRMKDTALSRRADPRQQAADKAKIDDWNNTQSNLNINKWMEEKYGVSNRKNLTPEQLAEMNTFATESGIKLSPIESRRDLMDEFQSQGKGPVLAGKEYLDDNGNVIGHTTDTNGSTGIKLIDDETGQIGINQPVKPRVKLDRETGSYIPIDETGKQTGPAVFPGRKLDPEIAAKSKYAVKLNELEDKQPGMARQVYDLTRGLMSVDAPFGTSAAFRQAAPLVGTKNWFKAWDSSVRAFGSESSHKIGMDKIKQRPLFQPKQVPNGVNKDGSIKYVNGKSFAEEVELGMTDLNKITHREEMIRSQLAEKIPVYGKYIRASNRAYTTFLNQLRADQLETLVESAKAVGKDPTKDLVLGKQIADIINDQTGRGKLGGTIAGKKIDLEHGAKLLTDTLWSPRLMASRMRMLYPEEYLRADPFVRKEYFKSMARMLGGWGAFAGGFGLSGVGSVSMDPNNADFGKIKVGNSRFDPGAGFLQYMVYAHRMLPQIETWEKMGIPRNEITERILGGGGTTPSTGGDFNPFGEGFKPATRFSTSVDFALSKAHPTIGLGIGLGKAGPQEPFNVYDKTLQAVLPMFVTGMAEMYTDDPDAFWTLMGGAAAGMSGMGAQTYKKGDFGKPAVTPFLDKVLGTDIQQNDIQIGR